MAAIRVRPVIFTSAVLTVQRNIKATMPPTAVLPLVQPYMTQSPIP